MADYTFKVKGDVYAIDFSDVNGLEARAFRRAVGVPILKAFEAYQVGAVDALEFIAGLKWMIDSRDNPKANFDEVLESLTYDSLELDVDEEEPEEDFPTQGADSAPASPPSPVSTDSSPGTSNASPLASSTST